MPGAIILSVTYGIDVKSADDPFLNASLEASHALSAVLVPGKFLADSISICACICTKTVTYKLLTDPLTVRYIPDWFPGTGFKALAKEVHDKYKLSIDGPMQYVKNAMKVSPQSSFRIIFQTQEQPPVRRGVLPLHNVRLSVSAGG